MNDDFDAFWQRFGLELEAEETASRDDSSATARVRSRLLAALPAKRARKKTRLAVLLAAAALFVASVAAAAALVVSEQRKQVQRNAEPAPRSIALSAQKQAAPTVNPLAQATPNAKDTSFALDRPTPSSAPPNVGLTAGTSAASSGGPRALLNAPSPIDAASLLSAAGQARRRGDARHALALLDDLQARFPNSAEARVSDIALGKLQLQRGDAAGALQHFDRYLQRSPHGSLAADAWWGRSQALFAASRVADARAALSALLARYPSSPYASAARAKLRAE